MERILLDTNMLLSIFRFNVNLEALSTYKMIVTESVAGELRSMRSQYARAALSFISERCEIVKSLHSSADNDLLEIASALGCILATNDRELRRRAKAQGIRTAYLREKKKITFDGAAQI